MEGRTRGLGTPIPSSERERIKPPVVVTYKATPEEIDQMLAKYDKKQIRTAKEPIGLDKKQPWPKQRPKFAEYYEGRPPALLEIEEMFAPEEPAIKMVKVPIRFEVPLVIGDAPNDYERRTENGEYQALAEHEDVDYNFLMADTFSLLQGIVSWLYRHIEEFQPSCPPSGRVEMVKRLVEGYGKGHLQRMEQRADENGWMIV